MANASEMINSSAQAVVGTVNGTYTIFGNTLMQYGAFAGIVILFFLFSKLAYRIVGEYLKAMAKNTKTELDDVIIEVIEGPVMLFMIILGIFFGKLISLTAGTQPYIFIDSLIQILIVVNVAWAAWRFIDAVIVRYLQKHAEKTESKLDDQLVPIIRKILQIIIIAVSFIFLLGNFGFDVTTLIAGLGIGGIAVALAAQDSISNFIGSIVILTSKPFKQGDFVRFGQNSGTVREVTLRSTKLETSSGTYLIIPNNKVVTDAIENFGMAKTRMVQQTIGLSYRTSARKLERAVELLCKIASSHPNVARHDIKFMEHGPYSLNISMMYWIKDTAKLRDTPHEINMEIRKAFEKEKIEMASQIPTVELRK